MEEDKYLLSVAYIKDQGYEPTAELVLLEALESDLEVCLEVDPEQFYVDEMKKVQARKKELKNG